MRWRSPIWGALLLVGGCAGPFARSALTAPITMLGEFEDDYGNRFSVSSTEFLQLPHGTYTIAAWHSDQHYLIAQNASTNKSAAGKWTRIDWILLNGMAPYTWAFCLSAYDAPSADSAEATHVVHPDVPRTGCNGYPYSRMKRVGAPAR